MSDYANAGCQNAWSSWVCENKNELTTAIIVTAVGFLAAPFVVPALSMTVGGTTTYAVGTSAFANVASSGGVTAAVVNQWRNRGVTTGIDSQLQIYTATRIPNAWNPAVPTNGSGSLAVNSANQLAAHYYSAIPEVIYRGGGSNPGNLTPRVSDNGVLSFRDSLSNPWPLPAGQRPVFGPGDRYTAFDTSKLPLGSVIPDGNPAGHVSVSGVDFKVLKDAVIRALSGKFRK